MKHRRNASAATIVRGRKYHGINGRSNPHKKSGWVMICVSTSFLVLTSVYIVRSTFELFTEYNIRHQSSRSFSTRFDSDDVISSRGTFQPNSTDQCHLFDHGDFSPFPNLTSVFNCNSPSGKCKWFYPAKFFNQYCGIGKRYVGAIDYMESRRLKGDLWKGGPPIVLPWVLLHPGIKPNGKAPGRIMPLPRHNLSMIHVHKTGGTSLVSAFSKLSTRSEGKRMMMYKPISNRKRLWGRNPRHNLRTQSEESSRSDNDSSEPKYRIESSAFLSGAVKYRKNWNEREHTLFAVVRDPAERFISAIGQATGAFGSANNGVAAWLRDQCVKMTGRETLRCFVDVMMKNETWIEVHFTPMVYEISFATMYKDIPVAVFPFIEVPTLMYELNQIPGQKMKDGKKKGFRKSEVLTHLSVQDYDEGTLRDLCRVYEMDCLFMRYIGYATKCDSYISFNETIS